MPRRSSTSPRVNWSCSEVWWLSRCYNWGLPLWACFIGAVAIVALVSAAFEEMAIRPLLNKGVLAQIIATVGAAFAIETAAMIIWGREALTLPAFSGEKPIGVAGATVVPQTLWVVGLTLVIVVALQFFYRRTLFGKAVRACAVNPTAARLQGISYRRVVLFSFALSGAISAAAGVMITPVSFMGYSFGSLLGLKGFAAATLGGMGNPVGAVAGGFLLGILEALGVGLVSSGYKDAIAFVILLLVLFLRPAGLLGAKVAEQAVTQALGFARKHVAYFAFAVVIMTIPVYLSDSYYLSVLAFMGTRFMMALGLSLLLGQAGQVSLGQAAFVGIGAYGAAILTTRLGINPWLAMASAALLAAVIAGLVGMPTLKLKGHYLAMATLGINEIVYILLVQLKGLTNGTDGITGIPSLSIGGLDFGSPKAYHLLVWGVGLVMLRFSLNLTSSRVGRSLRALRRSEPAAESLGVDTSYRKVQIFMLAAAFASIAGSFDAYYVNFISPESYNIGFSIILVTGVIIGGLRSVWGALWGSLVIVILPEILKRVNDDLTNLVFGVLLVVIMIFSGGQARGLLARRRLRKSEESGGSAPPGFEE